MTENPENNSNAKGIANKIGLSVLPQRCTMLLKGRRGKAREKESVIIFDS